jgi:hypothetical protein
MDVAYCKMPTEIHAVTNTLGVVEGSHKILNVDKALLEITASTPLAKEMMVLMALVGLGASSRRRT